MGKHSSSFRQLERKKPSPIRGLLPIMGLSLAVLLGVTAFFLSSPLVDWARGNEGRVGEVVANIDKDIPANWPEDSLNYVVAVVLWLVMFSVAMTVVAAAVGPDPEKLSLKDMPASPANKKDMIKQMKRDLKEAKRREQARKKAQR